MKEMSLVTLLARKNEMNLRNEIEHKEVHPKEKQLLNSKQLKKVFYFTIGILVIILGIFTKVIL